MSAVIASSAVVSAYAAGFASKKPSLSKETKAMLQMKERGLKSINVNTSRAHVYFLADDLLEGRQAGRRGSQIARQYILSQMRQLGIEPYSGDSYVQEFSAYSLTHVRKRPRYQTHPDSIAAIKQHAHYRLDLGNVLAMIPGKKTDEYVIVGAHYDHEGMNSDLAGDKIYNGADDNASGVSAVLQIMRAFVESGATPERNVIFAFWDGEEYGLLGSQYFVETFDNPVRIKGYLNFDMVGRDCDPADPEVMYFFYTESHPAFEKWLKDDIATYGLRLKPVYRPWNNPVGGSDNGSFALKNIPIMWYHTNAQPDYNYPTDEADRINYDKLTEITKASYLNVWGLANEEEY